MHRTDLQILKHCLPRCTVRPRKHLWTVQIKYTPSKAGLGIETEGFIIKGKGTYVPVHQIHADKESGCSSCSRLTLILEGSCQLQFPAALCSEEETAVPIAL